MAAMTERSSLADAAGYGHQPLPFRSRQAAHFDQHASWAPISTGKELSSTIPTRETLEKVRRDKVFAQAQAFQDAKSARFFNRYKREESKIISWENQQRIKANAQLKKVEMRLEQKRAKALEKMQNEIAWAHKKAEERKASAEAVRAVKTTKVTQLVDSIRRNDKISSSMNVGCFPF